MRPQALIFDFGNVVAHFDYGKACAVLGSRLGLSGEAFRERVEAAGLVPLAHRYECGKLTAEAFSEAMCGGVGLKITHAEFASAWSDIFWLNEPVARLVASLKANGYVLVLGSNTNDLHAAHFRRQFAGTMAHFDRQVLSYEVGHAKPAAEFYRACIAAAGAPPEACVFIDDMPENVAGARAAGIAALVYRDEPTLRYDLRQLGVEFAKR